jgi:predicted nucleic acid-binding protein
LTVAFIDTSVLLAVAFGESGSTSVAARLAQFDQVYASDLLEAELRSACRREHRTLDETLIAELELVVPLRSLRSEVTRVLGAGYVRGADCFHLACALHIAVRHEDIVFLTLDNRQRDVAIALGFAV